MINCSRLQVILTGNSRVRTLEITDVTASIYLIIVFDANLRVYFLELRAVRLKLTVVVPTSHKKFRQGLARFLICRWCRFWRACFFWSLIIVSNGLGQLIIGATERTRNHSSSIRTLNPTITSIEKSIATTWRLPAQWTAKRKKSPKSKGSWRWWLKS